MAKIKFLWCGTGKEVTIPDLMEWVTKNNYYKQKLVVTDLEGLFVNDDGTIILCDECGNWEYVANGVFKWGVSEE